jgi:hypothetical protein
MYLNTSCEQTIVPDLDEGRDAAAIIILMIFANY